MYERFVLCTSMADTFQDPSTRKIKIITIGAGFSGILLAYQIQKHCQNVENVIYEKNADLGGTWLENRYPGYEPCAVASRDLR